MEEAKVQDAGAIRSDPPQGLLYHYTTQAGLLGILKSKSIWATHIRYLNDTSEGQIFAELLQNELKQRTAAQPNDAFAGLAALSHMMGRALSQHTDRDIFMHGSMAFSWIIDQDAFVTSFSGEPDLLSQWRAYSGDTGYSIGFTGSYLESAGVRFLANRKGSFCDDRKPLVPCRYCNEQEKESLKREIKENIDSYSHEAEQTASQATLTTKADFMALGRIAKKHFFPLGKQRAVIKDWAFREEAEWRLVFQLERMGTTHSEPEFRPGRSMLIPYFDVKLASENQPLEIPQILIGPCPHPVESKKSVERLLRKKGVRNFEVKNSEIPYRNW